MRAVWVSQAPSDELSHITAWALERLPSVQLPLNMHPFYTHNVREGNDMV